MDNLKRIVVFTAMVYSLTVIGACYAQTCPGKMTDKSGFMHKKHGQNMTKNMNEIYSKLNLTDEQKKKLEENRARNREKAKGLAEAIKTARESLDKELMKPELDMARINELKSQIKSAQSELLDERLNSTIEVRNILTAEQFSKFVALKKEHWKK